MAGDTGMRVTGFDGLAERVKAKLDARLEAIKLATRQNALGLEDAIKEGIASQAPGGHAYQPLHPYTIAMRLLSMSTRARVKVQRRAAELEAAGGTAHKALMNHGDLYASITHAVAPDGMSAAVGVNRKAKDKDGKPVIDIARIVFYGCVIQVTARMRAYLHSTGLHLSPATTHLVIPPRPTIEPVYRAYLPTMRDRYRRALKTGTG